MENLLLNDNNIYLFHQGTNYFSYKFMGAHITEKGVTFSVWAPEAKEVRVVGDFNDWDGKNHVMKKISDAGLWLLSVPEAQKGNLYKYEILTKNDEILHKSDPYAFFSELRPKTASVVYDLDNYEWNDKQWLQKRKQSNLYDKPVLIYEVHLGSWKKDSDNESFNYRDLAHKLVPYLLEMGYTHVELLPILEHPFDGSWGYQITGYYSVTRRYGNPEDFKYFVDYCHQNGLGVILDWVPGHFCKDGHGLYKFDGTPVYESEDSLRAENPEWGTVNFDLGKPEVISFLISNAIFWLNEYHIDGLRVDAVASMLYLDQENNLVNQYGGKEDLEAISFIKKLNEVIFEYYPGALMIAEDSTAWPLVTKPTHIGGLGFNYKWNMGWMNDMLKYMDKDPIYRKYYHNLVTFSFMYTFSENFILPISHDEVVHGKKSLLDKMPGDYWQKFANLRGFYAYMIAHPGKKLHFMGSEFGQFSEWDEKKELDWFLLDYPYHKKLQNYFKEINKFYKDNDALWKLDHSNDGFMWIDPHNMEQSIICFIRYNENGEHIIVITNFTPVVYHNFKIGVPELKTYREIFNSDKEKYGGSGQINSQDIEAENSPWHNQNYSLELKIPPLATVFLR